MASSSQSSQSAQETRPNVNPTTDFPTSHPDFKVYAPPNGLSTSLPTLSDDYFTPTTADLQAAQATLSARHQAYMNAPLQLRARREQAEKAKRDRWPTTTIRVRFSDRTQLEKVFSSTEKIRSVYAFVRGCLRDDAKPIKFILYQSPPKRDLKVSDPKVKDLTLVELQLAPASVLLLRFEDDNLNLSDSPAPLLPSVLQQVVELPILPSQSEVQSPAPLPSQQKLNNPTPAPNDEKKIPKWLKLGKKK